MARNGRIALFLVGAVAGIPAFGQQKPASPAPGVASPIPRAGFIASMDAEFRKMDADKDGQLTRVEIEQFQKLADLVNAQARNREAFAKLDADQNGQLSPAEFARIAAPASTANATPMLTRMDANRDQQISLIEHRSATLVNFDRLDVDRDGIVTAAEMRAGGVVAR